MTVRLRRLQLRRRGQTSELRLDATRGGGAPVIELPRHWGSLELGTVETIDCALGGAQLRHAGDATLLLEIELDGDPVVLSRRTADWEAAAEIHETALDDAGRHHLCSLRPLVAGELARTLLGRCGLAGFGRHLRVETAIPSDPFGLAGLVRFAIAPRSCRGRIQRVPEDELVDSAAHTAFLFGLDPRAHRDAEISLADTEQDRREAGEPGEIGPEWPAEIEGLRLAILACDKQTRAGDAVLADLASHEHERMATRTELFDLVTALRDGNGPGTATFCAACLQPRDHVPGCPACSESAVASEAGALPGGWVTAEEALVLARARLDSLDRADATAEKMREGLFAERLRVRREAEEFRERLIHLLRGDEIHKHALLPPDLAADGEAARASAAESQSTAPAEALHRLRRKRREKLDRRVRQLRGRAAAPAEVRQALEQRLLDVHGQLGLMNGSTPTVDERLLPRNTHGDPDLTGWLLWQLAVFEELHENHGLEHGLLVLDPFPDAANSDPPTSPLAWPGDVRDRLLDHLGEWLEHSGTGTQIALVTDPGTGLASGS